MVVSSLVIDSRNGVQVGVSGGGWLSALDTMAVLNRLQKRSRFRLARSRFSINVFISRLIPETSFRRRMALAIYENTFNRTDQQKTTVIRHTPCWMAAKCSVISLVVLRTRVERIWRRSRWTCGRDIGERNRTIQRKITHFFLFTFENDFLLFVLSSKCSNFVIFLHLSLKRESNVGIPSGSVRSDSLVSTWQSLELSLVQLVDVEGIPDVIRVSIALSSFASLSVQLCVCRVLSCNTLRLLSKQHTGHEERRDRCFRFLSDGFSLRNRVELISILRDCADHGHRCLNGDNSEICGDSIASNWLSFVTAACFSSSALWMRSESTRMRSSYRWRIRSLRLRAFSNISKHFCLALISVVRMTSFSSWALARKTTDRWVSEWSRDLLTFNLTVVIDGYGCVLVFIFAVQKIVVFFDRRHIRSTLHRIGREIRHQGEDRLMCVRFRHVMWSLRRAGNRTRIQTVRPFTVQLARQLTFHGVAVLRDEDDRFLNGYLRCTAAVHQSQDSWDWCRRITFVQLKTILNRRYHVSHGYVGVVTHGSTYGSFDDWRLDFVCEAYYPHRSFVTIEI